MGVEFARRDYSLVGPRIEAGGRARAGDRDWYACPIPRKRLKELMQRQDGPAIRDTIIWFAAFGVTGGLGYLPGAPGGPSRSSSPMACSTARPPIRAGTNAATAPPSRRAG